LRVVPNGKAFEQPCAALLTCGSGLRCSIYDERPHSCRRFVCKLYDQQMREGGPIQERIAVVRRVRVLLASLERSGFGPADFEGVRASNQLADPRAVVALAAYLELMSSLERDFSRAR
jgi:hypothetical protein